MIVFSNAASDTAQLNLVSLRFADQRLERRFLRLHLIGSLWVIRLGLFCGTLLYAVFGVLDAYVGQDATEKLWLVRYGFVVPIMTAIVASTYTRLFVRHSQFLLASVVFTSGFGIVLMTVVATPPVNHWYYAGLIMVVIYASSIIRLHHTYSLGVSLLLVGSYQVSALALNPVPDAVYISNNFFLTMSVAVGAMTNYLQEFFIRTKFAQTNLLSSEKARSEALWRKSEQLNRDLQQKQSALARAQRIARLGGWDLDLDNDEMVVSVEARRILGLGNAVDRIQLDEFLGIVHPVDRERVRATLRSVVDNRSPAKFEHRIVLPGGAVRVLQQQVELSSDSGGIPKLMSAALLDVTERSQIEENLRAATLAAENANRTKSQFLANMSHELRTPLNAIIGYSELLGEDAEERGDRSTLDDLDRINTAGRHLLSLVNDVLDLSKIEAGKAELCIEEFAITPVVDEVTATLAPMIERNGNRLAVDCRMDTDIMTSDQMKLRQILYNLLSNAAKFTQNGDIRVNVHRAEDHEDRESKEYFIFAVADTGVGIVADQIEAAFTAFEQTDSSRESQQPGTGLGLPICRHFCAMMGGTISVDTEPGKGSTFTVRLPARIGGEVQTGMRYGTAAE